jgi:streptogramin lyase
MNRNDRIVKLSPTGKVLAIWGNQMAFGMFGITVDLQGNVYFAEFSAKGGARKLSPSGAVLATWPATCIPPG